MTVPPLVTIKLLRPSARMPEYATAGAAGADIYACIDAPVRILPGERQMLPAGFSMALPSDEYAGLIYNRSGLGARHGIMLSNCVGVIDSDYRGEVHVSLYNSSDKEYTVNPGDRIAQLIITKIPRVVFEQSDALTQTGRDSGGFGSTGR